MLINNIDHTDDAACLSECRSSMSVVELHPVEEGDSVRVPTKKKTTIGRGPFLQVRQPVNMTLVFVSFCSLDIPIREPTRIIMVKWVKKIETEIMVKI